MSDKVSMTFEEWRREYFAPGSVLFSERQAQIMWDTAQQSMREERGHLAAEHPALIEKCRELAKRWHRWFPPTMPETSKYQDQRAMARICAEELLTILKEIK